MSKTCTTTSFIKDVVASILERTGVENLADCCLLTPNRRTMDYLKQALASAQVQPVWAPRVLMIEEWAAQLTNLQPAEPLTLLLELWATWSELVEEDANFESFFSWSQSVLSDFNRLDNALLDISWVYSIVGDWHELSPDPSELFATEQEPDRQQRLAFWRSFAQSSNQSHQRLKSLFHQLHDLYLAFAQRLTNQGIAYQGLINRMAADKLAQLTPEECELHNLNSHWFWIGFSDLKASELALLRLLRNYTTVETYWDVDAYYIDNSLHAAGRWFREAGRDEVEASRQAATHLISSRLNDHPIEVQIIAAPGQVAQTKYVAQLLSRLEDEELDRTAIVLPDESQLFPLLMSMPANVRDYNITMGSSLAASPFYRLVEKLFEVQTRCELRGTEPHWPRDLVQAILLHPYIRRRPILNWMEDERDQLYQQLGRSRIMEIPYDLDFAVPPALLFERIEKPELVLQWVIDTLYELAQKLEHNTRFELPIIEREQLFAHYAKLIELRNQLQHHQLILEPEELARVALLHLQTNLPFSGEPLASLQIMGLRETRNLDFDRVFILSMNEGIVPPAPDLTSLIPDELTPILGLPGWREQQDHACYMIWRCMQRASHVVLLYSNFDYGDQSTQASRILDQIRYEWRLANPKLQLSYPSLDASSEKSAVTPPTIPANNDLHKEALHWLNERGLSVSALNSWLTCRLKFGLGQLLGLKKLLPLTAELEARHEGSLLHEAMEALYKDLTGRQANSEDFKLLSQQARSLVRSRLLFELGQPGSELTGEACLTEQQIVRRIQEIINKDGEHAPFEIAGLEEEIQVILPVPFGDQIYEVKCKGIIDRIDRLPDGSLLLIDYKTGKNQAKPPKALQFPEQILDWIFGPRTEKNQTSLDQINQALFYLWLYRKHYPESQASEFAWYAFDTQSGHQFKRKRISELLPDIPFDTLFFRSYEAQLVKQIQLILDPIVERYPTTYAQICKTCDFVSLCWRDEAFD